MENAKSPAESRQSSPVENGRGQKKTALSSLVAKGKKLWLAFTTFWVMSVMEAITTVSAFAEGEDIADVGNEPFNEVVNFFATWIGRIGLVVGFIGAVQFGLAIKNDDADAKTRGLMTMAAGFVVFGVTAAVDTLFLNVGGTTTSTP